MNIKRFIDQNNKLIMYVIFIIVFVLLIIKSLNSYYEQEELDKLSNITQNNSTGNTTNSNISNNNTSNNTTQTDKQSTETISGVMSNFVKYCNNKEIEKAYNMLTDECKNAMYTTKENFERLYINEVFQEKKEYTMLQWAENGNMTTYQIKFFGDILASGNQDTVSQEYYTFIKKDDIYKININNYIYGKSMNKKYEKRRNFNRDKKFKCI